MLPHVFSLPVVVLTNANKGVGFSFHYRSILCIQHMSSVYSGSWTPQRHLSPNNPTVYFKKSPIPIFPKITFFFSLPNWTIVRMEPVKFVQGF